MNPPISQNAQAKAQETLPNGGGIGLVKTSPTQHDIEAMVKESWASIAPFWPLKNLIAVNPLQGLEHLPFEEALEEGHAYFQQRNIPESLRLVNQHSITWLQLYCDEGQAGIPMPHRDKGFWAAWKRCAVHDNSLFANQQELQRWVKGLPDDSIKVISECLMRLAIPTEEYQRFLTLMLTTLAGWAAHVKYRTDWVGQNANHAATISQADMLAMRLVLCVLCWKEARHLLRWYEEGKSNAAMQSSKVMERMRYAEQEFQESLLHKLQSGTPATETEAVLAQWVFCIDVRSEPFRHALEQSGAHETYGFAGFFGVPVSIEHEVSGQIYDSCPVLLKPKHHIKEKLSCGHDHHHHHAKAVRGEQRSRRLRSWYQALKYHYTTSFAIVEAMGAANGVWMACRSFAPRLAETMQQRAARLVAAPVETRHELEQLSLAERMTYGATVLKMIGLTNNFAPFVILCGHGGQSRNNAYASALDCGACGGNAGAGNARILAAILNQQEVREVLAAQGIQIPKETLFIGAEHNTTTDEVRFFPETGFTDEQQQQWQQVQQHAEQAKQHNSYWRLGRMMPHAVNPSHSCKETTRRASDWSEVRPEWGLAQNAAFIIAPRSVSRDAALDGRAFLHSYDWQQDADGSTLTTILTAPMVVAQWINSQYCFSTLDNISYGSGSKITHNVTGKMGIMQGNGSDLMHGLPLQSVFATHDIAFHTPQRLLVVVYAPRQRISDIIGQHEILQKLLSNGWVRMVCHEPQDGQYYALQQGEHWVKV